MKNGVDDAEAFASLVHAVNLRLRQARQYRNARPLWKPATPKPNKEAPPTRSPDAPDMTTPALGKPSAEVLAKEAEKRQTRITLLGIGLTAFVTLSAALIGLIPWLVERNENASATQAALALRPSSTATATLAPTPTATLDIAMIVASLDAKATIDQATANVQATAAARLTEFAAGTQNASNQTATATLWTATPTPNITASIDAFRTQQAQTATRAWIDSWTDTPTPTPDPLQVALDAARSFTGINADWRALYPDGFRSAFEDSVQMVLVPVGCFMMGSDNGDTDERPVHEQCFEQPFWIDLTEVTQADFERLGGRKTAANGFPGSRRPVENISWFEARDFCASRGARLPTEREWEYTARGPSGWIYPWGVIWNDDNTVWKRDFSRGTMTVARIPAGRSWVGAFDLIGNVWEWTSSRSWGYPYDANDGREANTRTGTDDLRIMRGGSWNYRNTSYLRAAKRISFYADTAYISIGFRCARDA